MAEVVIPITAVVGVGSEILGLINKHVSPKVAPSVIGLIIDIGKLSWYVLSGQYSKDKEEKRNQTKAQILSEQIKQAYKEVVQENQIQNTQTEQEVVKSLKTEHELRLQELEVRLGISKA